MTNGELHDLGEDITERIGIFWPTIKSACKPYETEGWFVELDRLVELWRDYR